MRNIIDELEKLNENDADKMARILRRKKIFVLVSMSQGSFYEVSGVYSSKDRAAQYGRTLVSDKLSPIDNFTISVHGVDEW